jgi:hypothetical protein
VNYATADGTATVANNDYVATNSTLTFATTDVTKTINVTINGDTTLEPDENFFVNLSGASGATIADAQGVGTIQNDELPPGGSVVSIADNIPGFPGDTVTIPVLINNVTGLLSSDIQLNYPTQFLNATAVRAGSLINGFTVTPNINDATGTVNISSFGTNAVSGGGTLVEIDFAVDTNATIGANLLLDLVTVSLNEGGIAVTLDDGSLEINTPSFQVTNLEVTPSGFIAKFSQELNPAVLNLYDGLDSSNDLPDLVLTKNGQVVKGSVVWDSQSKTLTFVKTGGILDPGNYNLVLDSRSDGFVNLEGELLDGNADGNPGTNYTNTFTVVNTSARILRVPDFTRGPEQPVNLPANDVGIPVTINNAQGISSLDFDFVYNDDLLDVTGAAPGVNLPGDWQVVSNLTQPGVARISLFGTTTLTSTTLSELVIINADIPDTAPYRASDLITLESISINEGAIQAQGDTAIQQVAFFGETTGNGGTSPSPYSGLDASLIARVGVGLDTGFDSYPITDPVIVGDISGNGALSGLDASKVAQVGVGILVPEIPPLP